MKLSRNITQKIGFLLDEWTPPLIRDSRWFIWPFFRILFKDKAEIFFNFKDKAPYFSELEYIKTYEDVKYVLINRETDLNRECLEAIKNNVLGKNILEVGCGKGFLSGILSQNYNVKASDILIDKELENKYQKVNFIEANIENLPFQDKEFDTVISTHTLEHVRNFQKSVSELRRVTKKRLIIVVPMQRPYRYTFDLHLRFFPYPHSFLAAMENSFNIGSCKNLGGDLFYIEDF